MSWDTDSKDERRELLVLGGLSPHGDAVNYCVRVVALRRVLVGRLPQQVGRWEPSRFCLDLDPESLELRLCGVS